MKIPLKLSPQQLGALVHSFNAIGKIPVNTRDVRVARSILDKVIVKLKKKHIEIDWNQTLFSKKKKTTLTLEYYEAHYLEYFVTIVDNYPMSEYDRNVIRYIKNDLNQKLA
ncbi:hypothetical protein [Flavobacterium degerlachei]|jgi:hypothetical protein|uniref:Uncharacterized protein n=1 Tax=Flavobacterium degerlachei TaxID=229203 RepID=A0A1H2YZZ9_9FLAO|nr:hypothetical protein [Flavobacterium degerlachei]SDX10671.1 hypothetical protein SAMN05444338_10744 [Flavobacterium degerlachei]